MAALERFRDLLGQNAVKRCKIDQHFVAGADPASDGDFNSVEMSVRPRWTAARVAVRGMKRDRSRERAYRAPFLHHAMPSPIRSSGVATYCDSAPVVFTALDLVAVPGSFVGSSLYDAGYTSFQKSARASSLR